MQAFATEAASLYRKEGAESNSDQSTQHPQSVNLQSVVQKVVKFSLLPEESSPSKTPEKGKEESDK